MQKTATPPETAPTAIPRASRWPLLAGVVALVVYLLTISHGAYPGPSAALIASTAGLIPEHLPDHPVWSLLTRELAQASALNLPLHLNLFSALCGSAAVALFGWLVSCFIFHAAREDDDDSNQAMSPKKDASDAVSRPVARVNARVAEHNRHAAFAALLGGWIAALALAFSVPFWSACTRFDYQPFDVLLLLVILHLVRQYRPAKKLSLPLAVAAFLCGAGCVESEIFIPLAAALFLLLPIHLVRHNKPWERTLLSAVLLAGVGAGLGVLLLLPAHSTPLAGPVGLRHLVASLLRTHYHALRHCLPHAGWVWIVLLAFAPAAVALPTARKSFSERNALNRVVLHLLFLLATLLCLFNVPVSPWGLACEGGYLTVVPYLLAAAMAGYLAAYWRLLGAPEDSEDAGKETGKPRHWHLLDAPDHSATTQEIALSPAFRRWTGVCIGWPLLLFVVCVFPLLNWREADGRQGAFADAVARDALAQFGGRDWIASSGNGLLDCHLLLAARAQGRELRLLPLAAGSDRPHMRQLQAWIDAEPAFAGQRERLRTAADLGVQTFLAEWLRSDPSAEKKLAVVGTSAIWRRAGWQPDPIGFGYGGTPRAEALRNADLLEANRVFWTRMDILLAPAADLPPPLDRLRRALRLQVSRAANDLGVVLQDQGRNREACEAYRTARRLDAANLSALINLYFLAESGVHADEKAALGDAIGALLGQQPPLLTSILDAYGEIRNTSSLAIEGRAWSLRGQPALARIDFDRALALNPGNVNTELQLASFSLTQGDTNDSERIYRTLLAANPADIRALLGLASVALIGGRTADARRWLDQARAAGAPPEALLLRNASLLIQTGQLDEAIADLHADTDKHPDNIEAWSMLADALLRRNAFAEIEQRVLPSMRKAAGPRDHVLIHILNAQLLCRKTPVDFAAARISYLRALALRPDLASVRNSLLALDQRSGNTACMEADASSVIRTDPDDALANYLMAAVLLERNDLPHAEQYFQRSLAAHRIPNALNDFAELLRRQKRFGEAEKTVREALAQNSKSYQAWDTLGCILLDTGKADEAAQAIDRALALCATDARLQVSLARVRIAQGRPDEARRVLREIPAHFPSVPDSVKTEIAALERRLTDAPGVPLGEK